MSTEMNDVIEAKAVTEEVETVEPEVEKPKRQRAPRTTVRSIEEIIELPVKKLNDKEKEKYIEHLLSENNLLRNKVEAYDKTSQAAFAQSRTLEEQYTSMETYYRNILKYVDGQLKAFTQAINQGIKGGVQ